MRNQNTFGDKNSNWRVMTTNMAPLLEEMPHLQPIHTDLLSLIGEADAHDAEQEAIRGRLRELSAKRRELERRGQSLRSRAAAHLKGAFGYTSEQLVKFGLNPLPTRRKRAETRKNPAAAPPVPAAPQPPS